MQKKLWWLMVVAALFGGAGLAWLLSNSEPSWQAVEEPVPTSEPVMAPAEPAAQPATTATFEASEPVLEPAPATAADPLEPVPAATPVATAEPAAGDHGDDGHDAVPQLPPEMVESIRQLRAPTPTQGQVTEMPDGSKKLDLGNSAMSVPVATRGPDGKVQVYYHGEAVVPTTDNPAANNNEGKQP